MAKIMKAGIMDANSSIQTDRLITIISMEYRLKPLEKIIIAIGALDIIYIVWIVISSLLNSPGALPDVWRGLAGSESQSPELIFVVVILFNVSILMCGIWLVKLNKNYVLLNYLLLPFRILLGVPTLYPLFNLISFLNMEVSATISLALLLFTESTRVALVRKWRKSNP